MKVALAGCWLGLLFVVAAVSCGSPNGTTTQTTASETGAGAGATKAGATAQAAAGTGVGNSAGAKASGASATGGTAGTALAVSGASATSSAGIAGAVVSTAGASVAGASVSTAGVAASTGGTLATAGMPPTAAAGSGAGEPPAADPSPGCTSGTIKPGHTNETIQIGSTRREYVQTVPSSYDGKKPFAVLLDFHGGTYDGPRWDSRASNKFHDMAETENFIYITPTGLNQWWTTTEGADGADGMFMRALLDKLKTTGCVDNRRVYSTGCSMGGDMSFYMACYFSDVIAASLPLCGSASFDLEKECKPKRPVSLQFVIGSQDTLNCWAPPRTSVGNPCATEVQAVFKTLNGCTGEPKKTHDGVCETLDQCAEGTEITICMVDAQHTTIYTNTDIDIYKDGWEFLKRYYIH